MKQRIFTFTLIVCEDNVSAASLMQCERVPDSPGFIHASLEGVDAYEEMKRILNGGKVKPHLELVPK